MTVNVTGARLKVAPVLFEVWVALTSRSSLAMGSDGQYRSPHDVNVTDDGLTVATAVSLDDMERTSVLLPVRLQPCLPSPFVAST